MLSSRRSSCAGRRSTKPAGDDLRFFLRESASVLREPACVLLAAAFGLYTFQYFVIAGFLPVLLVSALHLDLAAASLFTTLAVIANAGGNIGAGVLLRAGVPLWFNMLAALAAFALAAPLIFSAGLPPSVVAVIAALTLGVGGLMPGSIFAAILLFAARRGLVTPTVGLIQQASNLGQFAGPIATGLVVARFGWRAAPIVLIPGRRNRHCRGACGEAEDDGGSRRRAVTGPAERCPLIMNQLIAIRRCRHYIRSIVAECGPEVRAPGPRTSGPPNRGRLSPQLRRIIPGRRGEPCIKMFCCS